MIRGFLISLLSLSAIYCVSQEAGALPPDQGVTSIDSSNYITDLVHIIKENARVVINWRLSDSSLTDFFSIERSCNGKDFEVVAVLRLRQASQWFEWIDESPSKGKNVYRIKCSLKNNRQIFSRTLPVQIAGDISFKFYPNPVDNILIIRSENAVDLQISDATGKMRLSQSSIQGLQTINVSSLEKGIYILRLHNKLANTIVQDRLIKN